MRLLRRGLLPVLFILAACTIKLLPDYDAALYDGLNSANEATHTLFSSVSGGSTKSAFAKHGPAYDNVIGKFAALASRAETRPQPSIPKSAASRLKKIPQLTGVCSATSDQAGSSVSECFTLVTPRALTEIIETLTSMRDLHKAAGLGALTQDAFVGDYQISIEQALAVEAALQ